MSSAWLVLALSACIDSVYIAEATDTGLQTHPVADAGTQDLLLSDHLHQPDTPLIPDSSSALDSAASDALAPDTSAPDNAAPDTTAPDSSAPDTSAPDTSAPDSSAPDSSAPDNAAPDNAAPDNAAPDTSVPDITAPDTSVPDTTAPDVSGSADAGITTVDLPPAADAWLRQGSPDSSGGGGTHMTVGFCTGASNGNMKIWLQFDLSALPPGAFIVAAEVKLFFYEHWGSQPFPIHRSADDTWEEQSITWNNQPAYDPEILDTVAAFTENDVWRSWDVTVATTQEYEGDGDISLVVEGETLFDPGVATDDAESRAYSKEYAGSDFAPRLVVSYQVP